MSNQDISNGVGLEEATGREVLLYCDYQRYDKRISRLIPGIVVGVEGEGIMWCPRCSERRPGIPHGEFASCANCDLRMERWGNGLYISE